MNSLSAQTIETIKKTAPLLAQEGPSVTAGFYQRMFEKTPELLNLFNQANQIEGTQAQALFNAVLAYANNIDQVDQLGSVVTHIAHKHAGLGVQPEQYEIVGKHLLKSIEVTFKLKPDDEILIAWQQAYQYLANIFIEAEEEIYKQNEQGELGWRDFKSFVIDEIVEETKEVKSFFLKPADGKSVQHFKGGQYVSVKTKPNNSNYEAIRQYSLSSFGDIDRYRITTKKEKFGAVTQLMHSMDVGDTVELHAPTGVFTLNDNASHHVFISGGVGITALKSMVEQLQAEGAHGTSTFIQCVREKSDELFASELSMNDAILDYKLCLEKGSEGDGEGFINQVLLSKWLPAMDSDYYLCGPLPFMKAVYKALKALGVNGDRIHYEVFGPSASIEEPVKQEVKETLHA